MFASRRGLHEEAPPASDAELPADLPEPYTFQDKRRDGCCLNGNATLRAKRAQAGPRLRSRGDLTLESGAGGGDRVQS